jgi:hypothetical protein
MARMEIKDAYAIEKKVRGILAHELNWEVKKTNYDGHDFYGRPPGGLTLYCDIKAYKDRVKRGDRTRAGRPKLRHDSHARLMKKENVRYLWVKYKKPNGDIELVEIRMSDAAKVDFSDKGKTYPVPKRWIENAKVVWRKSG